MDIQHTKQLVEFGNLRSVAQEAILAANGTLGGMTQEIDRLLRSLTGECCNRMELGLAAFGVREKCKKELHWMPVRKALAKCIRKSKSTVDNIIKAAVKAKDLGDCLIAALVSEGIDPTEKKYDALIADLLKTHFSGTYPEACEVVKQALVRFRSARKKAAEVRRLAKAAAELKNPSRTRRMLRDRIRHVPSGKRSEAGLAIFREFANAFEAEFSESLLRYALEQVKADGHWSQNDYAVELTNNAQLADQILKTATM
jgi:Arc/MetJ-type ribon-helix-helix transcriptional regulator